MQSYHGYLSSQIWLGIIPASWEPLVLLAWNDDKWRQGDQGSKVLEMLFQVKATEYFTDF